MMSGRLQLSLVLVAVAVPAFAQDAEQHEPPDEIEEPQPLEGPAPPAAPAPWFRDPSQTRGFYGPTGFMLRRGKAVAAQEEIYGELEYALTDHLSVHVGTVELLWIAGADGINLAGGVKVGGEVSPYVHLSACLSGGLNPFGRFLRYGPQWLGLALGTATFGSPDANVTLSGGAVFNDFFAPFIGAGPASPVLSVAAHSRIQAHVALETEHWFFPQPWGSATGFSMVNMAGVRLMAPGVAFHLGAMSSPLGLHPWLGVTWGPQGG